MEGFPIGSGMVESAVNQYKGRFCGAGMRWSCPGAERLIPIRADILSKRFFLEKFGAWLTSRPQIETHPIAVSDFLAYNIVERHFQIFALPS
jgi:hypothetical protein